MESYPNRPALNALTTAFWREALAATSEHAVAQVLVAPPGSREEYGPTTAELPRYGVPDTKLSWVAWASGSTVILTTASPGE